MSDCEEHFRGVTRDLANKIIEVVEAEASRLFSDGVEAHDIAELSVNAAMLAFAQLCATGGANGTDDRKQGLNPMLPISSRTGVVVEDGS